MDDLPLPFLCIIMCSVWNWSSVQLFVKSGTVLRSPNFSLNNRQVSLNDLSFENKSQSSSNTVQGKNYFKHSVWILPQTRMKHLCHQRRFVYHLGFVQASCCWFSNIPTAYFDSCLAISVFTSFFFDTLLTSCIYEAFHEICWYKQWQKWLKCQTRRPLPSKRFLPFHFEYRWIIRYIPARWVVNPLTRTRCWTYTAKSFEIILRKFRKNFLKFWKYFKKNFENFFKD